MARSPVHTRRAATLGGLLAAVLCSPPLLADSATQMASLPGDLTALSLDQLLNIEVTSVSKRPESLSTAAAAIYVLTGDDIRRSGVHRIADALRMVPGLDVAQSDSRTYAISARGFNATSADKMQVLLDGRTVYTPLTSAVFWDVLDTYLPDIDRIEVIRGPGATLWGANAVNGVINIVTKHATDTLGTQVTAAVGTTDRSYGAIRSGTKVGDSGALRIYAKAVDRAPGDVVGGSDAHNGARFAQAGFRSDWTLTPGDSLTVSADAYGARFNAPDNPILPENGPTKAQGGNVNSQWTHTVSPDASWTLRAYYDHYRRQIPGTYGEVRDNGDIDFQHQLRWATNHMLTWGAGYHSSHDETASAPDVLIVFTPASRILETASAFAQDQWQLDGDRLVLTLGSKFEHNSFTGYEVQPGARIGWHAAPDLFTWAAISRAVRTPNRLNSDVGIYCSAAYAAISGCTTGQTYQIGNPNLDAENLTAYEVGVRAWSGSDISIDIAGYYNQYRHLLNGNGIFSPYDNKARANSYGGELTLNWNPLDWVRTQLFYSALHIDADTESGAISSTTPSTLEGASPKNSAGLRLYTTPFARWNVDAFLRYVDNLPVYSVPAYTELDLRIAYQPVDRLELSLSGQNLLDKHHLEFGNAASGKMVERAVLAQVTWSWQ